MRRTSGGCAGVGIVEPSTTDPAPSRHGPGAWWAGLAVCTGLRIASLSQRAGLGGGSIIGGRVTLAMHPGALRKLAARRRVVLVSGTNGKTTTSHMVATALATRSAVAHNASGSNMADGAVAALAAARDAPYAVLEVDELHLADIARRCSPTLIVLLNLTRDQLDRAAEVRRTAAIIGDLLAELPGTTVLANADDPMVVWAAARSAGPRTWITAGSCWSADSLSCPQCGGPLAQRWSRWHCDCGLRRPTPDWWLHDGVAYSNDSATPLAPRLPGAVNAGNALMALAAARHEQIEAEEASKAIGTLEQVAGRYATINHGRHTIRMLLAKNPAGWAATLSMLNNSRPLLITVNAREADGRDTSWLWDVDFDVLRGRPIAASGERAADLGVRLSYAELDHHTDIDPVDALNQLPGGEVDVVANYTAFHSLRRRFISQG